MVCPPWVRIGPAAKVWAELAGVSADFDALRQTAALRRAFTSIADSKQKEALRQGAVAVGGFDHCWSELPAERKRRLETSEQKGAWLVVRDEENDKGAGCAVRVCRLLVL